MATMVGANVSQDLIQNGLITNVFKAAAATTKIHLYKTDVTPSPASVVGDFTECDFTGYAALTVTAWSGLAIDPATGLLYNTPSVPPVPNFLQTGIGTINTVYGFYIEDGAGVLILAERFDNPVQMDLAGKNIQLFPKIFANNLYGPDAYED